MSRAPIAHIPVRIGGVNGYQTPGAIDSGVDVNVMAMSAMKEAKLESRFRSGSPRFTQANGNESVASGWLETVIGLGNNFELGARFIIKEGIDYDVLLGTTSMRSISGIISFVRNRFEFPLPLTKQWRTLPLIGPKRKGAPTRVSVVGSTSLFGECSMAQEQARKKELCTAHMEDVFGGEQLATALPTGEVEEERDLDNYAGIPDLLSSEDDSDDDDEEILLQVTRCREPPDNPTIPKDIELPQEFAQQENNPDADVEDYAFGIIFSSLQDVRRHFTNLVVKGLINLTEAREQTARYNDLFRTMRQEKFLHPICTSHLRHLHASARLEVLTDEAQDTLNPLDVEAGAPEGQVNHAVDVRRIDAISLPRLPDKEQWETVRPQLKMGPNLTEEQKSQLLEVLSRHPHAFSKDPGDLGLVEGVHHRLDTGDCAPIKRARGQAAPSAPSSAKKLIARWHQWRSGMSYAPLPARLRRQWSSHGKKEGDSGVDFRSLNKLPVPSRYPLPHIDGILDKLGPAWFFTTLNAQSGYWQIPMHPDDVHKTAFLTHRGLFQFLCMPVTLDEIRCSSARRVRKPRLAFQQT
jgi:hypothetical protein